MSKLAGVGRHEYSLTGFTRGMYFLFGGASLAFGLFIASATSMRQGSFPVLILTLGTILLGVYLVALALRSRLIIDETGVEVHYAFRERSADLGEIEGFRTISTRNGSYWILLLKQNQGRITISKSFKEDDDLRAWFQQLTDLDERDRGALLEKIEQDQELGATPEDRLAALKQAKQWNILLSGAAIVAAVGMLFGGESLQMWCAVILALVPAVALYLTNKRPLLFSIFKGKRDPRTDLGIAFMVSGIALLIAHQHDHFVSISQLAPYILLVFLICGVSLFGAVRNNAQFWGALIGVLFVAGMYGFGLVAAADTLLDKSKGTVYVAGVTGKHMTSGKSTTYYLELEPWGPMTSTNNLDVSHSEYERAEPGDAVCLELRGGAFHAPWYRQVSCGGPLR